MKEPEQHMRRTRSGDALCQALKQEGCPVCVVTLEAMERVMDTWQYEGFTDAENRQTLRHAQGFCPRHTWQLTHLSVAFQLAVVYHDLLAEVLQEMGPNPALLSPHEQSKPKRRRARLPLTWRKTAKAESAKPSYEHCPFCLQQREIEVNLVETWITLLVSEPFRQELGHRSGLCLPHFVQARKAAGSEEQRDLLLTCQYTHVQWLQKEIQELIRKHDYRFLHEPAGEEMTSWRRAATFFVGIRGVK